MLLLLVILRFKYAFLSNKYFFPADIFTKEKINIETPVFASIAYSEKIAEVFNI